MNQEAKESQITALKSRRTEAAIHAGVYMLGAVVFFAEASGLDILTGHGNETVYGIAAYGLGLVGAMYGLLSFTTHDKIKAIE